MGSRELDDYVAALRARKPRLPTAGQMARLREKWQDAHDAYNDPRNAAGPRLVEGELVFFSLRRPLSWEKLEIEFGGEPEEPVAKPTPKKPRHRHPDPISRQTVKRLMLELAKRRARPHDREFAQEKIGGRLGLVRNRVQQAEALQRVGWDLLRSHPEFSANDDFVRWPSPTEAARLLASARAEN